PGAGAASAPYRRPRASPSWRASAIRAARASGSGMRSFKIAPRRDGCIPTRAANCHFKMRRSARAARSAAGVKSGIVILGIARMIIRDARDYFADEHGQKVADLLTGTENQLLGVRYRPVRRGVRLREEIFPLVPGATHRRLRRAPLLGDTLPHEIGLPVAARLKVHQGSQPDLKGLVPEVGEDCAGPAPRHPERLG